MTQLEHAIRLYILKAIELLGGSPAQLAALDGARKEALYDTAAQLGADRYLLAAIGSWGDTLSDQEALQELRGWNDAPWETTPHLRQPS